MGGVVIMAVTVVGHILVQEKITNMRVEGIHRSNFRAEMCEIGRFMSYEFSKTLEKKDITVKTPLGIADGIIINDVDNIVVINILRAAMPFVNGIMNVFSDANCGFVGALRGNEHPYEVTMNYMRIPKLTGKIVIVADPMLATGNTLNTVINDLKDHGIPKRLIFFNLIASKEGINKITELHPDLEIYTCAIDPEVNSKGYVVPGLGDAGDLCFGKPD